MCVCVCVLSSNGIGFVLMQQRICFTPRALGAQFGQDVPYVFAACRKHVIWLPSGCSMAFTHGQLRGTFLRFFFPAEQAMKCDVWSVVFCCFCCNFNILSVGEMQSI